jgi:hypothetical protein
LQAGEATIIVQHNLGFMNAKNSPIVEPSAITDPALHTELTAALSADRSTEIYDATVLGGDYTRGYSQLYTYGQSGQ